MDATIGVVRERLLALESRDDLFLDHTAVGLFGSMPKKTIVAYIFWASYVTHDPSRTTISEHLLAKRNQPFYGAVSTR